MNVLRWRLVIGLIGLALLLPTPTAIVAQASCVMDSEPNDAPEEAQRLTGVGCMEGTLPSGDQDLAIWEVAPSDATARWTFRVDGQAGLLTALKLFVITSDPGAPMLTVVPSQALGIARRPEGQQAAVLEDVLLPVGRYLLGISRSALAGLEGDAGPGYRYRIDRGADLPMLADTEPNDQVGEGGVIIDATSVSGDLDGSADYYTWQVGATDERWAIELQVPLGAQAVLELFDPEGKVIDTVRSEATATS
ncbi:MAG: hypothetical protein ACC726_15415, partial [Chloroflexota bacterium]